MEKGDRGAGMPPPRRQGPPVIAPPPAAPPVPTASPMERTSTRGLFDLALPPLRFFSIQSSLPWARTPRPPPRRYPPPSTLCHMPSHAPLSRFFFMPAMPRKGRWEGRSYAPPTAPARPAPPPPPPGPLSHTLSYPCHTHTETTTGDAPSLMPAHIIPDAAPVAPTTAPTTAITTTTTTTTSPPCPSTTRMEHRRTPKLSPQQQVKLYRYCPPAWAPVLAPAVAGPAVSSSLSARGPPLLISKSERDSWALLHPIVGLTASKTYQQLLMAAPIVVMPSLLHQQPLPSSYVLPEGGPPPAPSDVLCHLHPTKRVVVKKICRTWLHALTTLPGAPVGEVQALYRLQGSGEHPHVVPLVDMVVDDGFYYLVFPYADGGELFALVADQGGLGEAEAKTYFREVVAGLGHLKQHGLAHGDVSLENIMLSRRRRSTTSSSSSSSLQEGPGATPYTCRLIDLGLARAVSVPPRGGGRHLMGGKRAYAAPEVVAGTVEDWHAADMWSLGLCLYNMLTGMSIYTDPSEEAFAVLAKAGGSEYMLRHHIRMYDAQLPPLAAHLIAAMLSAAPADRPTLEGLMLHPWMLNEEDLLAWMSTGEGEEQGPLRKP